MSETGFWAAVFTDDFTGAAVDSSRWNVAENSNYGSGNREDHCYKAANTTVADGTLRLTGKRETVTGCGSNPDGGNTYFFTSGMVTTRNQHGPLRFKYRHGYTEARIRVPRGNIYWPAFWLVGAAHGSSPGWPDYGEFDITEIYGSYPDISESNFHRAEGQIGARDRNVTTKESTSTLNVNAPNPLVAGGTNDWHTYGFNWTADKVEWFIDGVLVRTYAASTPGDFAALGYEHSIILNLAMGGNGPRSSDHGYTGIESGGSYNNGNLNADLPGAMEIDYVKVWQATTTPPTTETSTTTSTDPPPTDPPPTDPPPTDPPPTDPPPTDPPPAATISITTPVAGSNLATADAALAGACVTDAGTVTVAVTAAGGPSTVLEAACDVDRWAASVPLTSGDYSVIAAQTKDDVTSTSESVGFTIDTDPPIVTLDQPAPDGELRETPTTFAGTCSTGDGAVVVGVSGSATETVTAPCGDGTWEANAALGTGLFVASATQTDAAGNTGTSAPSGFQVDVDAPVTTDNAATITNAWRNTAATVELAPTDVGSGVVATYYTTDGSTPDELSPNGTSILLTTEGVHTIKYFSVDQFGNAEPVQTASTLIRIDQSAPETTDNAASITGWARDNQQITLSPTDPRSGVAATYFTTDGSTPTTDSPRGTEVTLSTSGTYGIKYFSVDAVGNQEPVKSTIVVVSIDRTSPVTADSTASIGGSWKTSPVAITLVPTDTGSGVARTYFTVDGSTPTTASAQGTSVVLSTSGTFTIRYFSVDGVGNAEPVKTATTAVRVDVTPPSLAVTFPQDGLRYNGSSWSAGCSPSSRLCGSAAEIHSGLARVRATIRRSSDGRYWSGSSWVSSVSTGTVTASGTTSWNVPLSSSQLANGVVYTASVWSVDTAGNLSATSIRSFTYDTARPTTSGSSLASTNKNGAVNPSQDTFSVTFNEALSPASVPAAGTLTLYRSNGSTSYRITGLTDGTRTTGASGYLASSSSTRSISFTGTLALGNGNRTITFTVTGACSGSCALSQLSTTPRSGAFQFVPATTLRDVAGNAPSTSSVTASSQVLF